MYVMRCDHCGKETRILDTVRYQSGGSPQMHFCSDDHLIRWLELNGDDTVSRRDTDISQSEGGE